MTYLCQKRVAMIYVELPPRFPAAEQRLPFFLAMEEWLARERRGDYFFMWQVAPTVICGRNQDIAAEVNLDCCRAEGVQVYRRKSGGGSVFADRNNIMFSHITTSDAVVTTFAAFTGAVAGMLRTLGLDATANGRNDILIGDRKVSGYAYYHINLPGCSRAIVHGTMLYDADPQLMERVLTPSSAKLNAKGVASVRSRVTTIRQHSAVTLADFMATARRAICDATETLTDADISQIRDIERSYYTDEWLFGRHEATLSHSATADATLPLLQRVEGAGEFQVLLRLADGNPPTIASIDLRGDFFTCADVSETILRPLTGCPLSRQAIISALEPSPPEAAIPHLHAADLADMILRQAALSRTH